MVNESRSLKRIIIHDFEIFHSMEEEIHLADR